MDALAAVAEQLAQQPVPEVLFRERAGVVALEDLLRAPVVGAEILVGADVQLTAEDPLLHLAHAGTLGDAVPQPPERPGGQQRREPDEDRALEPLQRPMAARGP